MENLANGKFCESKQSTSVSPRLYRRTLHSNEPQNPAGNARTKCSGRDSSTSRNMTEPERNLEVTPFSAATPAGLSATGTSKVPPASDALLLKPSKEIKRHSSVVAGGKFASNANGSGSGSAKTNGSIPVVNKRVSLKGGSLGGQPLAETGIAEENGREYNSLTVLTTGESARSRSSTADISSPEKATLTSPVGGAFQRFARTFTRNTYQNSQLCSTLDVLDSSRPEVVAAKTKGRGNRRFRKAGGSEYPSVNTLEAGNSPTEGQDESIFAAIARLFGDHGKQSLSMVRKVYKYQKEEQRSLRASGFLAWMKGVLFEYDLYRVKLVNALHSKERIILFIIIDLIVDIAFCFMYALEIQIWGPLGEREGIAGSLEPTWLFVERSRSMWILGVLLSSMNFISLILRFAFAADKKRVFYHVTPYIDFITCVPFFISVIIEGGQYLYIPYFFRSWVVIVRAKRALNLRMDMDIKSEPFDPLNEKIITLAMTMAALVFSGMCGFQYFEMMYGDYYSLVESFYYIIITISTVGYGDIAPKSLPGRLVIVFLILVAITVLPGLISSTIDTVNQKKAGAGSFMVTKTRHVVVMGSFNDVARVHDILDGFLNTEDRSLQLHVVFLGRTKPNLSVKALLAVPRYKSRTTYLQGAALNDQDLKRCQVRQAAAAFVLSDPHAENSLDEEQKNILRVWSLALYAPKTPIYACNLFPETETYMQAAKEVLCVEEFKQVLMACNCITRGSATLILNLLRASQPLELSLQPWEAQFQDGAGNELYSAKMNPVFVGKTFAWVSAYIYEHYQIILVAVNVFLREHGQYHLMLNPGNAFIMSEDADCIYIAQDPGEISVIDELSADQFQRTLVILRTTSFSSNATDARDASESDIPSLLSIQGHCEEWNENIHIGQPDPPYVDGKTSLCHLLNDPPKDVESVILPTARNMTRHILVCAGSCNLFPLLCTLRSAHLTKDGLRDVVILIKVAPTLEEFEHLAVFPRVYFVIGDGSTKRALIEAGLYGAARVAVLSQGIRETDFPDSAAIMQSHLIQKMLDHRDLSDKHVVIELAEQGSIKFVHAANMETKDGKRAIHHDNFFHSPVYAAGRVLVSSQLLQILFQTFHNPSILEIVRLFCGVRYKASVELDEYLNIPPVYLVYIDVPSTFAGKSFLMLYRYLAAQGIIPIGLFRAPDALFGNKTSFVYTNPLPSVLVKSTDLVYVLKSGE